MNEATTKHPRAINDEPLWSTYTREYILPGLVLSGMLYYLYRHVLYPGVELLRLSKEENCSDEESAECSEMIKRDHGHSSNENEESGSLRLLDQKEESDSKKKKQKIL